MKIKNSPRFAGTHKGIIKFTIVMMAVIAVTALTACGENPELVSFKQDMSDFCNSVSELNESLNSIDSDDDSAPSLALEYLDELDRQFQNFAEFDFPEEYDYLESVADEAGDYMKEAVKSYHEVYSGEEYDEDTAAYARENSARAIKRVQVILDVLQGIEPSDESASE